MNNHNMIWFNIFFFLSNFCFSSDTLICMASPMCKAILLKRTIHEPSSSAHVDSDYEVSSNTQDPESCNFCMLLKKRLVDRATHKKVVPTLISEKIIALDKKNGNDKNLDKFNEKYKKPIPSPVATRHPNLSKILESPDEEPQKNIHLSAIKPIARRMSPSTPCTKSLEEDRQKNSLSL